MDIKKKYISRPWLYWHDVPIPMGVLRFQGFILKGKFYDSQGELPSYHLLVQSQQ